MRTSSLNGMLTSLATNYNRRNKDVKLYELANIYLPKALPLTELPGQEQVFLQLQKWNVGYEDTGIQGTSAGGLSHNGIRYYL